MRIICFDDLGLCHILDPSYFGEMFCGNCSLSSILDVIVVGFYLNCCSLHRIEIILSVVVAMN